MPAPDCGFAGQYDGVTLPHRQSTFGAMASIKYEQPYLCGTTQASSAWVMVEAPRVGDPLTTQHPHYAQAGYIRRGSDVDPNKGLPGLHIFGQWTKKCFTDSSCNGGPNKENVDLAAPAEFLTYRVFQVAANGRVRMVYGANQTLVTETGYSVTNDWDPRWKATWSGETTHTLTSMPGESNDKVAFSLMKTMSSTGSYSFVARSDLTKIGWATCSSACIYQFEQFWPDTGGTGFKIWTP